MCGKKNNVTPSHSDSVSNLKPETPQATICCYAGAAALVHFRLGRPGPPARGFKTNSSYDTAMKL